MPNPSDAKGLSAFQRLLRATMSRRRTGAAFPNDSPATFLPTSLTGSCPKEPGCPRTGDARVARGGKDTLREALRLLQNRGVITMRAGCHGDPVVPRPRSHDVGDAMGLTLAFESTTVKDAMNARVA